MPLNHPKLVRSLQLAYSAEKAAAYAYIGHAKSVRNAEQKKAIKQIEIDEWHHRAEVLKIMKEYDIPISTYYEVKFSLIGRLISASCFVIGWFMPFFFAGKLESGNVCEYFIMIQKFRSLDITKHDKTLYEMGIKEKEHEIFFLSMIKNKKWLPIFEKVFNWGKNRSSNDVDLEHLRPTEEGDLYCKRD